MWYFADFNILIRKVILNKFQFQPQSVLNLFLFFGGDFSLSVLIEFALIKKMCMRPRKFFKSLEMLGI